MNPPRSIRAEVLRKYPSHPEVLTRYFGGWTMADAAKANGRFQVGGETPAEAGRRDSSPQSRVAGTDRGYSNLGRPLRRRFFCAGGSVCESLGAAKASALPFMTLAANRIGSAANAVPIWFRCVAPGLDSVVWGQSWLWGTCLGLAPGCAPAGRAGLRCWGSDRGWPVRLWACHSKRTCACWMALAIYASVVSSGGGVSGVCW